jgi:hypothetical protein
MWSRVQLGSSLASGSASLASHVVAIRIPFTNIISPLPATNNPQFQTGFPELPMGDAVSEHLDFAQEADGCFRLAESETHAEVRTILMGMGYGWLTLANRHKTPGGARHEPFNEPTEEPADDLM